MGKPGLIIVGSGPAGVSAAEAFRRYEQSLPVTILTTDPYLPYERPPLSKDFLRGDTDDIAMHSRAWYDDRDIRMTQVHGVDHIAAAEHTITADGTLRYGALVLACGAKVRTLEVSGAEHVHVLRSRSDAESLRRHARSAHSAVVIGGGFIGCEAAASLAMLGLDVSLVATDSVPQAGRLGEAAGRQLLRMVQNAGVNYVGRDSVMAIESGTVHLDSGNVIHADLILAATGVRPAGDIARSGRIELHESRVVTTARMATSAPDVFAAGDVAFAFNASAGRHLAVEHWQDAVDQGEIAGSCAAGRDTEWNAVPGFWSTIGSDTIKYHAWGDGYSDDRIILGDNGFTVWYERDGAVVGVLTHNDDDNYDLGATLIAQGAAAPVATV